MFDFDNLAIFNGQTGLWHKVCHNMGVMTYGLGMGKRKKTHIIVVHQTLKYSSTKNKIK